MKVLHAVIITLIVVYADHVLSSRSDRRPKATKKPDNGPCGKRFLRQINGKCYYLAAKKMNWFGAQNNCLRKQLNLADLSTVDDFEAIVRFLRKRGNMEDFWFGGNDLQSEGRFTYISSGRPVRYYGSSDAIEPTLRSNLDDCLEIRLRDNATTVTDDNCLEQQYFICAQNELKCAQPVPDEPDNQHHSHEHLHHFHHDAAKEEHKIGEGSEESMESDSRPADNSDSAEIGKTSQNADDKEEEERTEGPNEDDAEDLKDENTEGTSEAETSPGTADEAETTTEGASSDSISEPDEGAETTSNPEETPNETETTAIPETAPDGETTAPQTADEPADGAADKPQSDPADELADGAGGGADDKAADEPADGAAGGAAADVAADEPAGGAADEAPAISAEPSKPEAGETTEGSTTETTPNAFEEIDARAPIAEPPDTPDNEDPAPNIDLRDEIETTSI